MKRGYATGMALILALLGPSLGAHAQEVGGLDPGFGRFGGGERHRMGSMVLAFLENDRVKSELGLTDQQTARLRQIVVDTEKTTVKTRADMAVQGIELRELLRADKPDEDAVMKKVQQISELHAQIMKHHVEALLAAKSILTPEQQKKIRGFIEGRGAGPWMERFRGMRRGGEPRPPRPPEPPRTPPMPHDE